MDGIASSVPLIARPSFDRACSFVPSEYVQAWEWFLREEQRGGLWDKLPHRTNADSPQYPFRLTIDSELFPVSRDSGIFWPGRGRVKHPREKTFALSVHNSKRGAYPDVPPLYLEDGTWVLKYSSQSASVENWRDQDYNQKMINCMECGVPVGVFFATSAGYKVLGLAFIERYEPENRWFVLHGPVRKGGPDARFFPDMSYMKGAPVAAEFSGAPASDDEKVRYALRRERIGQQRFRNQLLDAYTGRCAVSGCNVNEALEAAHIENYSGPKSQVVSNGILLRRDLHSLFDAHLISFELVRGDYQLCGSSFCSIRTMPRLQGRYCASRMSIACAPMPDSSKPTAPSSISRNRVVGRKPLPRISQMRPVATQSCRLIGSRRAASGAARSCHPLLNS